MSAFSPVEVTDHLSPAVNKRLFVNTPRGGGRGAVCPILDQFNSNSYLGKRTAKLDCLSVNNEE